MADPRIIVVGAGPAGVRAAQTLVKAGLRPLLVDEGQRGGGQIYRRSPDNFTRSHETLYGSEADKARAIHAAFDALRDTADIWPESLVWGVSDDRLHIQRSGETFSVAFEALVLATGATDRLLPVPGWTRPGCYSLGASQIALKAQGCAIGEGVVFAGSGPLLYLVAWQYMKAGITPVALLDTSTFGMQIRALPLLAARPGMLLKGMKLVSDLKRAGVPIHRGIRPLEVTADADGVTGFRYRDASAQNRHVACNAVGMGYHLRAESQLADLAGCTFSFHPHIRQWLPDIDAMGRSSRANVYLAGDGVRILGADGAEASGRLAALAVLADRGDRRFAGEIPPLLQEQTRHARFARGIAAAFPWPHGLAADIPDETLVCRCEAITAGELRASVTAMGAPEVNRAKAFSRVGMGRCQGRFCGLASQEVVAAACGAPVECSGRLRGQAPVKPLSVALVQGEPKGEDNHG